MARDKDATEAPKKSQSAKGMNREYKDRLFKFIFGNPENKEWTLSLYNAVNGSSYTNADDIEFNTIEDAVYMSMKNDTSFIIHDSMNFYEQQASFNPNMPMRFLIYAGMVYSKFVQTNENYHQYSKKQQTAPVPRCVCFYNGTDKKADKVILKLSDSFPLNSKPDIEVKVTMININYGHNKELMQACKPLSEYAFFSERIRKNKNKKNTLEEAVDIALDELPDDSIIKPFLIANKAEVKYMCITEYDEERTLAETKAEGRAEGIAEGRAEGEAKGRAEGIAEGILNTLAGLVKDSILTLADAAKRAGMTTAEFEAKTGLKA